MSPLRWMFKLMNAVHPWLYRRFGGRGMVAQVQGMPVLLLMTTGRRSGQRRTNAVGYLRDGEDLLVIASAGGDPRHPAWALNLKANPRAEVEVGRERYTVQAEWTEGTERDRLWQRLVTEYPFYAPYEKRAGRTIPILRLRRTT